MGAFGRRSYRRRLGEPGTRDPSSSGRRHRWPEGAWSPENPSPETGSDLSGLTEETYAKERSITKSEEQIRQPVDRS